MGYEFYKNTVSEVNEMFDDLKMQGDYQAIIHLVESNKQMLLSDNWNVDKIIQDCNTIIKLHNGL